VFVLVCYDIGDVANGGAERLKLVAQQCLNYGVRVQFSVFECRIGEQHWVMLRRNLLDLIDPVKDSLRFYMLCEKDEQKVEIHGKNKAVDPTGALVFD
jgi:CRISPR-associated protein Cas2